MKAGGKIAPVQQAAASHPPRFVQAKLQVGAPGEVFEQEADRVATEVLQTPASTVTVQRKCIDPEPFDVHAWMTSFFSDCGAVFPTGQTRRAMVEETIGPGPLPRQHFSTTPVRLTSALGLCPVAETACPTVDERGWESAHPAGRIDEATDRTTLWNFAVDVAALKPEHQQRLRDAAAAAPASAMIMVEGFASCSGSAAHNERLARSRAETAAAFLRTQRADLRIGMNYFGERTPQPPVTAGDGEAMARNRRVEIYVVNVARDRFGLPRFQLPTHGPLATPVPPAPPPTGSGAGP